MIHQKHTCIEYILRIKYTKHFTWIISSNAHDNPMRLVSMFIPIL